MASLTRFSVKPLSTMTRHLAAVASGRADPDVVIRAARVLSTYSERLLADREIWLIGGRIAAVKPSGAYKGSAARIYDARGGIVAPGPISRFECCTSVSPHLTDAIYPTCAGICITTRYFPGGTFAITRSSSP